MITALNIIIGIFGALFRRWWGGWEGASRLIKVPVGFILAFLVALIHNAVIPALIVSLLIGCAFAGWPKSFHAYSQRMGTNGPSLSVCIAVMGGCYGAYTTAAAFTLTYFSGNPWNMLYALVGMMVPFGYLFGWYVAPKFLGGTPNNTTFTKKFWQISSGVWFIDSPTCFGEAWLGFCLVGGIGLGA